MRIFQLARQPPQWLRVALAALLLAFAVNSLAHVAHQHDQATAATIHAKACGYCATFGSLGGAPDVHAGLPEATASSHIPSVANDADLPRREVSSARPRAPPLF
jgi:hypothetical protein